MLEASDYARAVLIQDACNLSGIVHAWSKVMSKIWEEAHAQNKGTDWVNYHPINICFASKVASLTQVHLDDGAFFDAFEECKEKAGHDD